jgi:hypothetical protein
MDYVRPFIDDDIIYSIEEVIECKPMIDAMIEAVLEVETKPIVENMIDAVLEVETKPVVENMIEAVIEVETEPVIKVMSEAVREVETDIIMCPILGCSNIIKPHKQLNLCKMHLKLCKGHSLPRCDKTKKRGFSSIATHLSMLESSFAPIKKKASTPCIVAIDNDECIGAWSDLSLIYTYFVNAIKIMPSFDLFIPAIDRIASRRGLREFYDVLLQGKASGKIHKIYMFTAASDKVGWVSFLKDALEKWYGNVIYDGMIDQTYNTRWHGANRSIGFNSFGMIKDINTVREHANVASDTPVIMFDDRPQNILNGCAIGVSPYKIAVNIVEIAEMFHQSSSSPNYIDHYRPVFVESMNEAICFPDSFTDRVLDNDLVECVGLIRRIFNLV